MSPIRARWFAAVTTTLCVAAGAAVLVAAALWPLVPATPGDDAEVSGGAGSIESARDALPLASFAPAWGVDLRRSLTDAPNAAAADVAPAAGQSIRLVGTIVDPARPRGVFVTNLGQMELRGVGEKAGGAEVLRIDERSATLMLAGRPVTLKLEKIESVIVPGAQPSADATGGGTR